MDDKHGKLLLGPGFPGDTGETPPAVSEALQAYASKQLPYAKALAALADARVLVPVVAVLGEVDASGADKTSDMATVLLTGADGRQALLAFTGTRALQAWQADARPVPVAMPDAAKAAIQDHAAAIVVDVAGPVPFAVEGEDLMRLAEGWTLTFVGDRSAWVR